MLDGEQAQIDVELALENQERAIMDEAESVAQQARDNGFDDGFEDGIADGRKEMYDELTEALSSALDNVPSVTAHSREMMRVALAAAWNGVAP